VPIQFNNVPVGNAEKAENFVTAESTPKNKHQNPKKTRRKKEEKERVERSGKRDGGEERGGRLP